MRRTTILVAVVALMVALFASAAYAAATAVYGTNGDEWVDESSGFADDRIYALDGDDTINAVLAWNTTRSDTDKLFGGKGTTSSPPMTVTGRMCSTAAQATIIARAHRATASLAARRLSWRCSSSGALA
jgi:hypothetical protein